MARGREPIQTVRAIGLMSGTSMDGVDVAVIETDGQEIVTLGRTGFFPYAEVYRAARSGLRCLPLSSDSCHIFFSRQLRGAGSSAIPREPDFWGRSRRLLRSLERPHDQNRGHRLNWNQRLGPGQNFGRELQEGSRR